MARFITLCSSSSGNAVYVGAGACGVLIDAGVSAKRIKEAMAAAGLDPAFIRAIFVTHEHTDHIAGLRVLAAQLKVPVYATRGTLAGLNNLGVLDGRFPYEPLLGEPVHVGDIAVSAFRTSHDAKESCGYVVALPGGKVGVCTDTGIVTNDMLRALHGCDLVLLESNYDDDMLLGGIYPPYLKARIRSDIGHLSNDACAEAAAALYDLGVRRFVLGHLSRENNTPAIARACTLAALRRRGAQEGVDFELRVAPEDAMPECIVF